MKTAYTTPSCVEEDMLAALKAKMAAMEATLKDKLASGEVSLETPQERPLPHNDHVTADMQMDFGVSLGRQPKARIPGGFHSAAATPTRKQAEHDCRSKANSNSGLQQTFQLNESTQNQSRQVPLPVDNSSLFTRGDLAKLKDRLRKALAPPEAPAQTTENNIPTKTKLRMAQVMMGSSCEEKKSQKPYGIFKTEPTPIGLDRAGVVKEPLKEVTAQNTYYSESSTDKKYGSSIQNDERLKFEKQLAFNRSLHRTYSNDVLAPKNHVQKMEDLEAKISRLKLENEKTSSWLDQKIDKFSNKNTNLQFKYSSRKENEQHRDDELFTSAVKSNINKMLTPSSGIKIPAYLMVNKVGRPSAKMYFESGKKQKSDIEKPFLITPLKTEGSKLNRSETINFTSQSSMITPKQPLLGKKITSSSSRATQKMDSLFDSFLKTKAYWDQVHLNRSQSRTQKCR